MYLKENSLLDRYDWTQKKINEITVDYLKTKNVNLFDIGSRDNILKKYITSPEINYKAFDLEPLYESTEKWNIEEPFPYLHPPAQVVALLEVIEHLNNPSLCLKNIGDTIAPGGYLILTTPNPKCSTGRVTLFATGELSCFTRSDLELNHHVFTPWIHMVEKILADSGFTIIEYVTLDGKTTIFDKTLLQGNFAKRFISRFVKKIIEYRDPSSCGMSYGIVAQKSV